MKTKYLIEKIEGEAELEFEFDNGKVSDVTISFPFYRGIEEILCGRDCRDALVITPRVCGICNHAHLIAAARALEDSLKHSGTDIELTPKAISLREFTLSCEVIQSHLKWFYLVGLPKISRLNGTPSLDNYLLKAAWASSTIVKALALFGGQWPHSSYVIPGGVSCDPTYEEIIQAEGLVDEVLRFVENEFLGTDSYHLGHKPMGDMGVMLDLLYKQDMDKKGLACDRFISFGSFEMYQTGHYANQTLSDIEFSLVREHTQGNSKAKGVTYDSMSYETGPLARAIISGNQRIIDIYSRYKDSTLTRVYARLDEVVNLLHYTKRLLAEIDIKEDSCTLAKFPKGFESVGVGCVEAARGSLIHTSTIKDDKIKSYAMITPTQWNLSSQRHHNLGVATEAMKGSCSVEEADFIFRTFDVCSVCTAH